MLAQLQMAPEPMLAQAIQALPGQASSTFSAKP